MVQSNYILHSMWLKVNKACLLLFVDTEGIHNTVTTPACFPLAKNPEEESVTQDF